MEEELIEYITKHLVNHPEEVTITRRESNRSTILELHVAQGDMGRVIGKNGRVANAIRSLLRALPQRRGHKVILEID